MKFSLKKTQLSPLQQITFAGALLAICLASQFFKNLNVYITGPIVNAALIIAAIYCGPIYASILALITPITAFFIASAPVMQAVPGIIPCIMLGNLCLVFMVLLFEDTFKNKTVSLTFSIVMGALIKGIVMGILISLIILPVFLPQKMRPKMNVLQLQFSLVQLTTALIGGVYALIINFALKKAIKNVN